MNGQLKGDREIYPLFEVKRWMDEDEMLRLYCVYQYHLHPLNTFAGTLTFHLYEIT